MIKNARKQKRGQKAPKKNRNKTASSARRNGGPSVKNVESKVSIPAAVAQGSRTRAPKVRNIPGGTLVCHQEYLFDVPSTTNFVLPPGQVVVAQPGLVDSNPWLAQIAGSYEQYRYRKLQFRWRPRVGTNTAGTVYMGFQSDSADTLFGSKGEMMAYEGSQENSFFLAQNFDVKFSDYMKRYFIRNAPLESGADNQLYDIGLFSVTAVSSAAQAIAGDLLVYYEIEFYKPKMSAAVGAGYYVNWGSSGSTLATMQQHPISSFYLVHTSVVPNALWGSTAAVGTSDTLTLLYRGLYMFACDINVAAGGTVATSVVNMTAAYGSNITQYVVRSTQGALGSNDLITIYFVFNVAAGGGGAENLVTFNVTGGTGVTLWTSDVWLTFLNNEDIGLSPGLAHPLVKRAPRLPPIAIPPPTQPPIAERKERQQTPRTKRRPEVDNEDEY